MSFYGQPQYNGTQQQIPPLHQTPSNLPYAGYSSLSGPLPYQQAGLGFQQPNQSSIPYPEPRNVLGFALHPNPAGNTQPYAPYNPGYGSVSEGGSAPYLQGLGYSQPAVVPSTLSQPQDSSYPNTSHSASAPYQPTPGYSQQSQNTSGGSFQQPATMSAPPYPSSGQQSRYPTGQGQPGYLTGSNQPGYPTGQGQPGYPTGSNQPGYPTGQGQPGYPTGSNQPGYPTGQGQPGYPTGSNQPGNPTGPGQPGYPTGSNQHGNPTGPSQPGYPTGPYQPGYPTGPTQGPGYPTGSNQPGYPTGPNQPGYPTGPSQAGYSAGSHQPGYSTGTQQRGYPTGPNQPGYPAGSQQAGYPTGSGQPGYPAQQFSNQPGYPAGSAQPGYPQATAIPQQGGYSSGAGGPRGQAPARPGSEFVSKVELRVECRNLLDKDVMSKSDPCAVMYMMQNGRYEEVGRTENIKNCLDPRFSRSFVVNYYFEEVQKLIIAVYDIDNATPQLNDDDFLGQIETTLGQLVSNSPFTKPLLLRSGRKAGNGVIIVRAEEVKKGTESVAMTFHAKKLDKKDFLGKSDPYLEVLRSTHDGSWQMVHRTEVVKNNLNPSWRPFEMPMSTLCGSNKQQNIKFDVYDWDSDGSHDYIGGFTTTLEEMLKASQAEVSWPCINPTKKAKKKSYNNSGIVMLSSCKLIKNHTFLDYIFGGMQVNFTVGIDFTGSNGHPSKPTSLHYINPHQPNEYMQAIRAVGDVCQDYDSDKMFPALGFGAKIPPIDEVLHEFAINFNPQNPYCAGIDGVLHAYYNCIQRVQLYGPTNASPIINHVANFAAAAQREESQKGAHSYFILLMLTDGVLSDMSDTRYAIVQASRLPMSLIIVGVGNADFSDMNMLDGDDGVLRAPNGEPVKRDIVQFVPFRDFRRSSSVELARHVLAEVPQQVTGYYKMRGMQPNKPVSHPAA